MSIFKNCKLVNTLTREIKEPVDISPFEFTDEKKKKLDRMMTEYRNAFQILGFDTENKDLIEVLAFTAESLIKIKVEIDLLQKELRQ